MKKFNYLLGILFTVFLIAGCSGGDSETTSDSGADSQNGTESKVETIELIAYSKWPDENHHSEGLKIFAEKIEKATDGRLIIDVKTGGALGYEGPEILKAVR